MHAMPTPSRPSGADLEARVQLALERCLDWSQQGRHRKVLAEVDRLLRLVGDDRQLEAQLLVWKAQALLSMGSPERALPAASASWQLSASPHACHLMANALNASGDSDRAEELLVMGTELYPEAVHLPIQLAMLLTDQGRAPEALEILEGVPPSAPLADEMEVFLVGLRANLLATLGRWSEADEVLEEGLDRHPDASLLLEAQGSITAERSRQLAEEALVASWRDALAPLRGTAAKVDDAIVRLGQALAVGELVALAAQRLWRALNDREPVRLQSPDAWAAALLTAVMEIDGRPPSAAAGARATDCSPSTVRAALQRVRRYLGALDGALARRAFGAASNPRLEESGPSRPPGRNPVVRFPR